MPLRFGPYKRDEEETPRPQRTAPDYTSRQTRFRLWILVGMVMLVITLMFEARKPEHYAWMWRGVKQPPAGNQAGEKQAARPVANSNRPEVKSKPIARAKPPIPIARERIPGSNLESSASADQAKPDAGGEADLLARTRKIGWSQVLEQLPPDEKHPGQDLLFALLRVARSDAKPTDDERLYGAKLLGQLKGGWTQYLSDAKLSIDALSEEERKSWQPILDAVKEEFISAHAALQTVVAGESLDDAQQASLDKLQSLLDQLAIAEIQDNTVPNRSAERHAWCRLFEVLGGTDEATLKELSQGTVGYVQLFKQPKDYRGKLVTVHGTVEMAYRVPALENAEGIKEYYIFWLRPAEGVDSPFQVYALETPPGFPKVHERDDLNQTTNRLQVDAEFTGYFFKKVAYLSRDDTRTTPLILARSPHFDDSAAAATLVRPPPELPSLATLILVLGGTGGFGLTIAAIAYFTTRRPRKPEELPVDVSAADLQRLEALATAGRNDDKQTILPP